MGKEKENLEDELRLIFADHQFTDMSVDNATGLVKQKCFKFARKELLTELEEKIDQEKAGLNTENDGICNPRCHDSGFDAALTFALDIIEDMRDE